MCCDDLHLKLGIARRAAAHDCASRSLQCRKDSAPKASSRPIRLAPVERCRSGCGRTRWVRQDPIGQAPEREERFACARPPRRVTAHAPCSRVSGKKRRKTWRWPVGTAVAMGSLGTSITERPSDVAAQNDEADIETQLRHYIRANPGAGDTAIGITSFWLCLPPTPQNIARVERILGRIQRSRP